MEKLQAALAKARNDRKSPRPAPALKVRSPRAAKPGPTGEDAHWQALPAMRLSDRALARHRVVTRAASDDSTPFDIMRTKILLQMQQNGWSRLAVTSPMPQSGKTTTACNLALGLGRQSGLRAMLFDFDLSDPSVHRFFEQEPEYTTGQLLNQDVDFAQQALRIGDNVAVSMSSRVEGDPTRILLSEKTEDVLDGIQDRYKPDIMIFDLPSVLVGDNTRAFLQNVDCALIIARANTTRYAQFDACEREIAEHTNVLGVVLNAFRHGAAQSDFE
jgi:Mrp family chromosome partitioning ATPase